MKNRHYLSIFLVSCNSHNGIAFLQHGTTTPRTKLGRSLNVLDGRGMLRLSPVPPTTNLRALQETEEDAIPSSSSVVPPPPSSSSSSETLDEASKLREQARKIRLEAQQLDIALTSKKIKALEAKINNQSWLAKHPDEESDIKLQLELLNDRLLGKDDTSKPPSPIFFPPASSKEEEKTISSSSSQKTEASSSSPSSSSTNSMPTATSGATTSSSSSLSPKINNKKQREDNSPSSKYQVNPIAGFDDDDLKAFVPVAQEIDARLTNATIVEKRDAFRTAPELQEYFKQKIQALLVGPLEEMQRLETIKREYLQTTSRKEKEALKREIDKLEQLVNDEGIFVYSDSVYCENLPKLTEEEIEERLQAVGSLPETLQSLYKHRIGVKDEDDLRLAIEVDHFAPQLQLLEQLKLVDFIPDDMRLEFIQGYNSMPKSVQEFFVKGQDFKNTTTVLTAEEVLIEIERSLGKDTNWSPVIRLVEEAKAQTLQEPTQYEDIEFVDRSRFLQEFLPSIADMESISPDLNDVETFMSDVLDTKKVYMVTSKPERVLGGYYIRGTNLIEGENGSDQMVARIKEKLDASPLADKLEFFYILDPSPLSDEDIEMENTINPVLLVTAKNTDKLYDTAQPLAKIGISLLGAFSALLFSVGSCALNPALSSRFTASLDAAADGSLDLQWLADLALPTFLALGVIQLAHELAHIAIGWKDKFDVGAPNLIPGVQFGLTGSITPLRSPPPNLKSLFDFAIAGPMAGLIVSFLFFISGLSITASMDPSIPLPAMTVDILRSSSLIGGMSSLFLGSSALMADQGNFAILGMHPFAIAGVVGLYTNALALLPLGHTDGGRISMTMFGRRGSFVVKLFTTPLLLFAGIIGLDNSDILLTYALFAVVWQRELETPVRNEVDELDFPRGLLGISAAVFVGLVLLPML